MTNFKSEEEFKKYFFALSDSEVQIDELAKWRRYQTEIVSTFIPQIKLLASEQYSEWAHFILELLQNADDNTYKPGETPSVSLTLYDDRFVWRNNEIGFKKEHVFAITYAAATTKTKDKTAATFIGEKGIGFKSVFAVADYVDIHSGPYDFRLKNDEFIVPYQIPKKNYKGTEISLVLKSSIADLANKISDLLLYLSKNAQEFTLFLQKIERLDIEDHIKQVNSSVHTARDREQHYYFVKTKDEEKMYVSYDYRVQIPRTIVSSRFKEIDEDIEREIIFAIPLPNGNGIERNGKLYSFLPTMVSTGTPIHIQLDAKTTANREDIEKFDVNEWNRTIFKDFSDKMAQMYEDISEREEFRHSLPEYWPYDADKFDIKNKDIRSLMVEIKEKLKDKNVILDRHGKFWPPAFVRMVNVEFIPLFYDGKYEKALSRYLYNKGSYAEGDIKDEDYFTFLDERWANKYLTQMEALDVRFVEPRDCIEMLREGPPSWVNINDPSMVRTFLKYIISLEENILHKKYDYINARYTLLTEWIKYLPIFPVRIGKERTWGKLTDGVQWVRSDSPDIGGNYDVAIVDPLYTYSPGGGGKEKEEMQDIRELNKNLRDLLADVLNVEPYNQSELLGRTLIKSLKMTKADPNKKEELYKLNEQWFDLYTQLWRREATIKKEEGGEEHWQKLLNEISMCKIPTKEPGKNAWKLTLLRDSFIGRQFSSAVASQNLERLYQGTNAPIIKFEQIESIAKRRRAKRERKINWADWYNFLKACGAKTGPYFVSIKIPDNYKRYNKDYTVYCSKGYLNPNSLLAQGIIKSIETNWEYRSDNATAFQLSDDSETIAIDPYSEKILSIASSDFVALKLSEMWNAVNSFKSKIYFIWGSRYKNRQASTDEILVHDQVRPGITVRANDGYYLTSNCFDDNSYNRIVLADLGHFVNTDSRKYNRDLMELCGLKSAVRANDLLDIIQSWYEDTPLHERSSRTFLPYLKAYRNLVVTNEVEKPSLYSSVPLYCDSKDALLPFSEWCLEIEQSEYPKEIVDSLLVAMHAGSDLNPEQALSTLFAMGDILLNSDLFFQILIHLGKVSRTENAEILKNDYLKTMIEKGIKCGDQFVTKRSNLPILWDTMPAPSDLSKILVIPSQYCDNAYLKEGAAFLEWRLLSNENKVVNFGETLQEIDDITAKRIFLSFKDITRKLLGSQPYLKRKLDQIDLFDSPKTVKKKIILVKSIHIGLDNGFWKMSIHVPYWFDESKVFYLDQNSAPNKVLPEFIDWKCGTTISPFFDYIWHAKESESRIYDSKGDLEDTQIPEGNTGGHNGDLGDILVTIERPEEDLFKEGEGQDESSKGGDTDDEGKTPTGAQKTIRQRSRLYSYVPRKGQLKQERSNEKKEAERRKKVDQAGAAYLTTFFGSQGAQARSVEDEDRGYDFVVKVGEEEFYVELKSSESKWAGWENCLSPNEFKVALDLKEKYFLCVVDKVFDKDSQMYFIRDPANEIDGYLFDSPWKSFSMDMESFIWKTKSDQGILEE